MGVGVGVGSLEMAGDLRFFVIRLESSFERSILLDS